MIQLFVAFFAGIVSFLSPCVLPIIPGFLAYLAGESTSPAGGTAVREGTGPASSPTGPSRTSVFLNSVFFVVGFSVVFALLGVLLNGILVYSAYSVQRWLAWIGGAVVIFFGLYLMGFIKIGFLEYGHTLGVKTKFRSRYLTSLLFGFAFAAGWTPCVGPVLGAILGLAASAPGTAFALLLAYAMGLGIPFLIVGLSVAQASGFVNRYLTKLRFINPIFGAILVVLGVLVFTQNLPLIANFGFLNNFLLR